MARFRNHHMRARGGRTPRSTNGRQHLTNDCPGCGVTHGDNRSEWIEPDGGAFTARRSPASAEHVPSYELVGSHSRLEAAQHTLACT